METLNLTPAQIDRLRDAFAWHVVDGMDVKTLAQCAAEQIAKDLDTYTPDEIAAEIADLYGSETLADLISQAKGES
jgi:hypothetical protein